MSRSPSIYLAALAAGVMGMAASGCRSAAPPTTTAAWSGAPFFDASEPPPLARFMRELVNVPFSFAVLEQDGPQRPQRFHGAAVVLHDAVRDLVDWQDPPAVSAEGQDVFYEYARHLERQVALFEAAARHHDTTETSRRLGAIRRTCDGCHRFFRPPGGADLQELR